MIDIYNWPTPNGLKPLIALEEMGLDYTVHPINIGQGDQNDPAFRALNPNGKIPVIVDRDNGDFTVFESGAILIYLSEKTGKFMPSDEKPRSQVLQWLMFQMGGVGPMMGQANQFVTFMSEEVPAGIKRYKGEVERLFGVMDGRLADAPYLAGSDYSIADMATWPWVRGYPMAGVDLADFSHLRRWFDDIEARPAVRKVIEDHKPRDPHQFAAEMQAKRKAAQG